MKKSLIGNLQNDIYCRISTSETHGVGVFAIKDIPKGTNPFKYSGGNCFNQKIIDISADEVKKLDPGVKKIVQDFYHKSDNIYGIPYHGPNSQDISFYMNTSNTPNVGIYSDKKCTMMAFKTLHQIKKGEELFINYNEYDEL
jgi:uncharacterized protein